MNGTLQQIRYRSGLGLAIIGLLAASVVLLLPTAACVTDGSSNRSAEWMASDTARHAVHGDKLVQVMSRIERYRRQNWPQEVESEYAFDRAASTERAFRQAQSVAVRLREAAEQIADVAQRVDMVEADRRAFLAQVGVLKSQVKRLEAVTANRNAEAMRKALRQIDMTCQSCHSRFRDVAGPIR